jgi:hypothetical protein
MNSRIRTPVGITTAATGRIIVVNDDGSTFVLNETPTGDLWWREVAPIPGTIQGQLADEAMAEATR